MVDYSTLEALAGTVGDPANAQLHEGAVRLRAGDKIAALRLMETARTNVIMAGFAPSELHDQTLLALRAEVRAEHFGNIARPTETDGVPRAW